MRISLLPKKVLITGIVAAIAGGAAAVTVPVLAAHHATSSAPAAADGKHAAPGIKGLHRGKLLHAVLRATAKETGLSRDVLRQRLSAGQTIDQIAGDKAQAIENDVLSVLTSRLDQAVAGGRISKDKATSLLATAKTRLETLMSTNLSDLHRRHPAEPSASPAAP